MRIRNIVLAFMAIVAIMFSVRAESALTPGEVAQKAASVISNAKTFSASFTLSGNGRKSAGSVKSSGSKFVVTLPEVTTWYNGKSLYTYNPRTVETTVTTPTSAELMESNPLLYVRGGGSNFTCKFSPVKRNGKYVVDLFPVKGNSGIKKMTFTVNATNFHTEKIVVTTSGGSMTIDVTSFKPGAPMAASEFEYPKGKYPKAEIIDLR